MTPGEAAAVFILCFVGFARRAAVTVADIGTRGTGAGNRLLAACAGPFGFHVNGAAELRSIFQGDTIRC